MQKITRAGTRSVAVAREECSGSAAEEYSAKRRTYCACEREGKPSETRFKVEERYAFATLVRCSPVTGRTHQIRVHTQYAGHPIAFDDRYGDREFDQQLTETGTGLKRLFLHAAALKFTHPGTGEVMRIEAPMDDGLKRCLQKLRNAR